MLLYVDAVISPADTGLIYITVTARISHAMSRNGNAPRALSRTTDRGVPLVSMLLAFVVGLFLFLPFPSWQQLVGFITSATVLSFGSGPLVLAAMRRQLPDHERTFRVPGGHVIPFLAFFSSNLIVYWTGWATNSKLFVAVLLGAVVLGITYVVHERREEPYDWSWRAGSWYLPWLGGLALLSWLGDYDGGVGVLHFDTAIPVILVFSAAVYWFAERVRLSPEEVEVNVEETRAESALEEAEVVPN